MVLAKGLIVKGILGCAVLVAGGGGIYYTYDHFQNKMTKFDRALIDFLGDGGKIKFAVKGENDTDLTSGFPDFTNGKNKIIATVKVKTTGSNESSDGKLEEKDGAKEGDRGKTETLRKLLGSAGGDWTWTCEVAFERKETEGSANTLADKEHLYKTNDGFFNKLNDVSEGHNKLKIQFLKNCAAARGNKRNREINKNGLTESEKEIKVTKTFELVKGDAAKKDRKGQNQDATKLYFKNEDEFRS